MIVKRFNKMCIYLFIILMVIFAISSIKININKNRFKSDIKYYLYNKKLYKQKDVKQIKVDYYLDRLILGYKPYVVSVIFSDEPKTIYYYSSTGHDISNNIIDYNSSMGGTVYGGKH